VAALVEKCFELKILRVHFERLGDIMDTRSEFDPSIEKNVDTPARIDDGSVEVTGLVFRHGLAEEPVLDNASFRIASGESVAFVGPSGAGKTTLLNILMGVYQPDAGQVVIGGLALGAANLAAIREGIATVLQDDVLLSGTVLDNITFFDPEPDTELALHCARMAAIHTDVLKMPMAYATLVGELGSVLSGGQKQRILIARALYRQPRILFMDEATSHLDSRNEGAVSRAMAGLNITRVLVAHRVETVLSADRILVVEAQQVREVSRQEFLGIRNLSRFGLGQGVAAVDGMGEPTHA
jgi:ATP-binding cassette subfamily B protein RaxB